MLGHIDPATGDRDEVWSTTDGVGAWAPYAAPFGEDGFAFVRQGFDRPPEVAVVEGGSDRTIASFRHEGHDHARSLVGRAERVTWNAPDGLEMDGFLLAPDGDGPHPLILHVHGGPVWSYQESFPRPSLSWLVSRGYAILMPNPRGSTGRGRAFLEAVIGDMGGADAHDDLAGVDALVGRGDADPERIGVTGGSYGGFMSCWLPVVDQRFKAAVAISPVTDYFSQHWNSNIGAWDSWFLGGRPEDGADAVPRAEPGVLRGPGHDADAAHRRDGGPVHAARAGDGVLPRAARARACRPRSRSTRARGTGCGSSPRTSTSSPARRPGSSGSCPRGRRWTSPTGATSSPSWSARRT